MTTDMKLVSFQDIRTLQWLLLTLMTLTDVFGTFSSVAVADNQTELVQAAMARVSSSVVRIRTIGDPGAEDLSVSSQITTGVVVSDDGEILTSSFGFGGRPAAVFVEDSNGQRVAARVVARDHLRKLVLLRCTPGTFKGLSSPGTGQPAVGATAIALGMFYPGRAPSVSVGIVSALNRIYGMAIQTDAKISPVNYGGPLIDLHGRIMGLLVPLSPQDTDGISAGVEWYDSGIGFCIPIKDSLRSAQRLRAGKDLVRGRLGVGLSTKNPLASEFTITTVHPESPAAKAGLQEGDMITKANDATIGRLGHFEHVVKSSYAGDKLRLVVKRGEDEIDFELVLAERLKIPKRGYFGVIPVALNKGQGEEPDTVSVRVLARTPADESGLPDNAQITKWGESSITSLVQLSKLLRRTFAGQSISVQFRTATEEAAQTVELTASERPEAIQSVPDEVIAEITEAAPDTKWDRSEESLSGEGGKVWLYAPDVTPEVKSGIIVLLSESSTPAETVLKKWEPVCKRHNLILVVPSAGDEAELSLEHTSVIRAALTTAVKGRGIDSERIVLVAQKGQAGLCGDLLFNLRAASLSAAVFVDCWPRVAGVSQTVILRKSVSALIQTGKVRSRQAAALQRQALTELSKAGVALIQTELNGTEANSPEEQIGIWAFNLKVR